MKTYKFDISENYDSEGRKVKIRANNLSEAIAKAANKCKGAEIPIQAIHNNNIVWDFMKNQFG